LTVSPAPVAHPDDPIRVNHWPSPHLAGAAFSSAGVVVSHAIAQALGGVLHIPHG